MTFRLELVFIRLLEFVALSGNMHQQETFLHSTHRDLNERPAIMVVDDEAVICDVIEKFLKSFGYQIFTFSDPQVAMEHLSRKPVDLVLTDLQMGAISGVDILRTAHHYQPDSVVILITGYPTVENAVQVLKEGAYDYITKPFRLDELGKVVQRGLEKQRLSREVVLLKETLSLYRISEAMNSSLELPQVLQMILNSAVDEAQSENGCIVLVDEKNESLVLGAARGELPPDFDRIDLLNALQVQQWLGFHESVIQPIKLGADENGGGKRCRKFQEEMDHICPLCLDFSTQQTSLCIPLRAKDKVIGVLYISRPHPARRFEERVIKGLAILASNAARAIENARLYNNLHMDYLNIIRSLSNAVEAKDPYTRGHSDRVVRYTQAIGNLFNLPVSDLEKLEVASILHDIGKIGISDQILLKPGGLTDEEFAQIKQHPIIGDRILQPIDSLASVRRWIYQHHERYDGLGYPEGIQGEEIDFQARILVIAEVFDALATDRAYKKAWSIPTIVDYLKDHAGSHFDPEIIKAFTDLLGRDGEQFTEFSRLSSFRILSPDDLIEFFKDHT